MIFGITAMILVGISWTAYGYVMGEAPKKNIKVSILLIFSFLFGMILTLAVGLWKGFPQVSSQGLYIALGTQLLRGLVNYVQLELMSKAMQKGPNGIIWSILQSGFIFPFFMGIVFFHEPLTMIRFLGFAVVLASLYLFGSGKNDPGKQYGSWRICTFAAFAVTGCSQLLSTLPSYFPEAEAVDSSWRTVGFCAGMALGGTFMELRKGIESFASGIKKEFCNPRFRLFCLALPLVTFISNDLLLYPGLDSLSRCKAGAISYPLMVSSCIIAFDIISLTVLREKHNASQWAALLLCIAGVVALSL